MASAARASGSSRGRSLKTSASVAAITSATASSSNRIAWVSLWVRSETTTGPPVTRYFSPLARCHWGIAMALRTSAIVWSRWACESPAFMRTDTSAALRPGNR